MRLLLIEDDPPIARELGLRWKDAGWVVRCCETLKEARAAVGSQAWDMVVLDLGLPDGDGLDWLQWLRSRDGNTPVLVVTARSLVDERVRTLRGGADDYLVKPFSPDELDARIDGLLRRCRVVRGEHAQFGSIRWSGREGRAFAGDRPLSLSPREFEVLGLLVRQAPKVLPKEEMAAALAERNVDVQGAACEVYVSRLRRKLAGSGTTIRNYRGFGYALALQGQEAGAA